MGELSDIQVRVIPAKIANPFVRRVHYSHKVATTSTLHFGAFIDGGLHGVMSFGNPMAKRTVIGLVEGTPWNGMLELNRMAFDDALPRNSESRCLSIAFRLIKKNAPHVKWILSFADATECGDGTIYRASNFVLTGIKRNTGVAKLPDGTSITQVAFACTKSVPRPELGGKSAADYYGTGNPSFKQYLRDVGGTINEGYQMRYIYFIDKRWRKRLTVPEIPYSRIAEMGASMYKGQRR